MKPLKFIVQKIKNMRNRILFLLVIVLFNSKITFGTNIKWWLDIQKMKPLTSTRIEVESIVGQPEMVANDSAIYGLPDGRLRITYSNGRCAPDENEGWKAPEGTVIDLSFSLEYEIKLSEFVTYAKIDLNEFSIKKGKDDTPPNIPYNYDYETEGINLLVLERHNNRFLRSLSFYIPDNYNYPKCKK
jgi:hypothetical protein